MTPIITQNPGQTRQIGFKLAKYLKSGDILALIGDLGGGKTTFLQGLGQGLGVKQKVLSPSFLQLKVYPTGKKGVKYLYHFDFYRLTNFSAMEYKGLTEYLNTKNCLVVIEWANRIKKFLPKNTKYIYFTFLDKNKRRLLFKHFKKEDLKFLSSL
ncbi:MAG: tRNA (adenosine(37)-N6)-threonylcarbamoyltransferase complex ATPase subunit type 1 TsaE [Patescibacteria group bacterium]